jgi:hypothetical protein
MSDKERKVENEPIKEETLDEVSGGYIWQGPTPRPGPPQQPPTRPGRMDPM